MKETQLHLQTALDAAEVGTWCWDLESDWYASPQTNALFGRSPHDPPLRYEEYRSLIHPDDLKRIEDAWHLATTQDAPYQEEYRIVWPDGSIRWLSSKGRIVRPPSGSRQFIGISCDITERKRTEEALRQSEMRYRMLHETMRDPFVQVAMDGRIIQCNDLYCRMLGYSAAELSACTYIDLTPERWHEVEERIVREQVLPHGYSEIYEKEYRRKDGTVFPVELRTVLARDEAGLPVAMWAIIRDITERKRGESAMRILAEVDRDLASLSSAEDTLRTVGGRIGQHLQLSAVTCWEIDEETGTATIANGWRSASGTSLRGTHAIDDYCTAEFIRAGREGEVVVVRDTQRSPYTNPQSLAGLGVGSFVSVPCSVEGAWKWLIVMADASPREWRQDEVELVRKASRRIFSRLERARADQALRRALEGYERQVRLLDGIASTTPDLVQVFDLQGRLLYANRRLLEVWGMELADAVGKTCFELGYEQWHHEMHLREMAQVIETRVPVKGEVPFRAPRTGTFGVYEYIFTPVIGSDGQVELIAGTTRDITERKLAEEALLEAKILLEQRVEARTAELVHALSALEQEYGERVKTMEEIREKDRLLLQQSRLAAMGEMLNSIAHQWRQPLNVVGMHLQRLMMYYDMGIFDRAFLSETTDSAMELIHHMSRTIDDFRNFFKPAKEKSTFAIDEAIVRTVALVRDGFRSDHIDLLTDLGVDIPITGCFNEFCQALLNIVQNARDAHLQSRVKDPRVTITSTAENGRITITVTDNAGGIPDDVLPSIFDPYFSTKGVQGTGIGLYMTKNIIETSMGGRISARNAVDGAEFTIEL